MTRRASGPQNPAYCTERRPTIRSRRTFRSSAARGRPRSTIRGPERARRSTPASARTTCSLPRTRTTRCISRATRTSSAGSTRACSTRPATRRSRRAGVPRSSTRTATAGSASTRSRTSRADPTQGHARRRLRLRHHRQPDRPIGLVGDGGRARAHRPSRAREQSAADVPHRSLRAAVQPGESERHRRVHAARHRRRSQRRHLDRPVGRTAHGVVRPPQVQDAERTDRHRPALRRGLDALSGARTADEGHRLCRAAPTSRITTGSISSTRSASARTCRS